MMLEITSKVSGNCDSPEWAVISKNTVCACVLYAKCWIPRGLLWGGGDRIKEEKNMSLVLSRFVAIAIKKTENNCLPQLSFVSFELVCLWSVSGLSSSTKCWRECVWDSVFVSLYMFMLAHVCVSESVWKSLCHLRSNRSRLFLNLFEQLSSEPRSPSFTFVLILEAHLLQGTSCPGATDEVDDDDEDEDDGNSEAAVA